MMGGVQGSGSAGTCGEVDPIVGLARASVEHFVKTGTVMDLPDGVPDDLMQRRAGVFVSLHERGELRGFIGTIGPTQEDLAHEIIRNGVLAASEDPRFPSVAVDELDYLEYSVDVLGEPETAGGLDDLDVREYGVIVTKGWRRGLLLPNLDGIDTVEQQVVIAKRKAGIGWDEDDVRLERFRVQRHTCGGEARRE